jgi:hypothetical protein
MWDLINIYLLNINLCHTAIENLSDPIGYLLCLSNIGVSVTGEPGGRHLDYV